MDEKVFSIKDLEGFSGIKAHTIRIWEQRYGILAPTRTDTNIRKYSNEDLKFLLNVGTLNSMGIKISKIACMNEQEMSKIILDKLNNENLDKHFQQMLKIAMVNYDEHLFNQVTDQFILDHGLLKTFTHLFIPFLYEIGFLWQAGAICPSNEHFISNLIRQKLISRTEDIKNVVSSSETSFVLYLPQLEIHDISLLMLNYQLKVAGFKTIYLGLSVPFEDLEQVQARLGSVNFVSIFTTNPSTNSVNDYLLKIQSTFKEGGSKFFLTGCILKDVESPDLSFINIFPDARALSQAIVPQMN